MYFPPSIQERTLLDRFFNDAELLSNEFALPIILLGDFNTRMGASTGDTRINPRGLIFQQIIDELPLTIHEPVEGRFTTMVKGVCGVIDLVISNELEIQQLTIHENGGSDHRPITFTYNDDLEPSKNFERWDVSVN